MRAVIKFLVKEETSAVEIHLRLQRAYGDVCMGASSVRRWVKYFEDGNTSIQDEPHSGRPPTASMECNKERTVLKLHHALREKRSGKKIILQHDGENQNIWVGNSSAISLQSQLGILRLPSFWFCKGVAARPMLRGAGEYPESSALRFIESAKGNLLLTHNGYIYRMNRQVGDRRFWICSEYKKDGCRGRCVTLGGELSKDASRHNHSPREDKIREKLEMAQFWKSLTEGNFTDRQSGRRIFWRCSEYQRIGCRGRIVTFNDVLSVKCSTHNHGPQDEKIREKTVMAEIKEQALLTKQLQDQKLLIQQFGKLPDS
ncbi:hypothetical protein ANN_21858 [Periplaneta americana]|uniref:FLYWCH-type domain-containing protein n=1 Tax=Periplaneta americana TaxID=6978 RepID=A0ABQ8S6I9_PERAM|nr:hypothetical protein ANN_21858 [Periplaneta americana]